MTHSERPNERRVSQFTLENAVKPQEPKPLPCPFCGSENVSVHEGSTFRWLFAGCDDCGAQAGEVRLQTLGAGAKDEWAEAGNRDAIEEWNKRANV